MNRKFLIMLAAICGAVVLVSILFISFAGKGEFTRKFIEAGTIGLAYMIFGAFAALYAGMLFVGKTKLLGMDEDRAVVAALLWFGFGAFFGLAGIISGTEGLLFGFWLYWIACLVGTFVMLLAANPALAKRIAEAAKSEDAPAAPAEEKKEEKTEKAEGE